VLVRCRINRLSHLDRVTGEPLRRYEHDHPGSLIHVDVTKFGNIPDGGGHRFVGRQHGKANARATAQRTGERGNHYRPVIGTAFVHTVIDDHSRMAYAEISPTRRRPPPSVCSSERWPGSPTTASPSSGSCRTFNLGGRHRSFASAGGAGSLPSGTCPSSLLDRVEREATPCLLTTLAGGATAGGRQPC
jgi:hypothetical protein